MNQSKATIFQNSHQPLAKPWLWWLGIYLVCAGVYLGITGHRLEGPTADNHFVHLAQSFLHGELGVTGNRPPGTNDWACFDEATQDICPGSAFNAPSSTQHWYISFPPMPAILLMPVVAIFGTATRDALFFALFGALAPVFLFQLLEDVRTRKNAPSNEDLSAFSSPWISLMLTTLFAFGTVFFFVVVQGAVWFAAQVVASVLLPLYLRASLGAKHPLLAGLALGALFLTRPTTSLLCIFFAGEALIAHSKARENSSQVLEANLLWWQRILPFAKSVNWKAIAKPCSVFALPILAAGAFAMWMNHARYHDPFEFGHRFLMIVWRTRIEKWGLFSYHYMPKNLAVFAGSLPWFSVAKGLTISRHGLALWFTTPWLLMVLFPKRVDARMVFLTFAIAATAIWNLMYQNSGWVQFGYRFVLDYLPALMLLLYLGGRRLSIGFYAFLVWAIAVNGFGAYTFDRAGQFYDDDFSQERLFQPD